MFFGGESLILIRLKHLCSNLSNSLYHLLQPSSRGMSEEKHSMRAGAVSVMALNLLRPTSSRSLKISTRGTLSSFQFTDKFATRVIRSFNARHSFGSGVFG